MRQALPVLGALALCWGLSLVSGYDIIGDVHPELAGQGPSWDAWLGLDHLGRDVGWRLVLATRAFVEPGLLAMALAGLLGGGLGAAAGWWGGRAADLVRALLASVAAIPRFALLLVICSIYGDGKAVLGLGCGLVCAPALAEAVYARLRELARGELVLALRAQGYRDAVILGRHLLWLNCRDVLGRGALEVLGFTLACEATLSYVGGYGVAEPQPSWGNMLAFEFGTHDGNPLAVLAPALALWLTSAALLRAAAPAEAPRG